MKTCLDCGNEYKPSGRNQKRCPACSRQAQLKAMQSWRKKNIYKGVGSGSTTGFGTANHMYKHGQCVFRRWAREKLNMLHNNCERCGFTIDSSVRGSWAGHHKDHNRLNNTKDNLEILCKRCHQVEHRCWTALQGVTTISKESTLETVEAHTKQAQLDDIVCSA